MRILLYTVDLLRAVHNPHELSRRARSAIEDPANQLLVSSVSAVELAIKTRQGKLPELGMPLDTYLEWALPQLQAELLPLTVSHGAAIERMPRHHSDPFDWMLIAQARVEGLPLITNDPKIARYDVEVIW